MIRLSREQVRRVDQICIDEYGLPGIVLMENAARSAFASIVARCPVGDVTVVCGGGNNGGDGYAIARHLRNAGWRASIVALKPIEALTGNAATMANVAQRMRLPIADALAAIAGTPAALLVDAVTGTGSTEPLHGRAADAVRAMNASGRRIVAIDLPSGLDCDTGEPLGNVCVRATRTVTFVAEKLGFANPRSREFTGDVVVGDIGCPREVIERARG